MAILKIFLYLIISFILSIALMMVAYYVHAKLIPGMDLDKVGRKYHRYVGPTIWLVLFLVSML